KTLLIRLLQPLVTNYQSNVKWLRKIFNIFPRLLEFSIFTNLTLFLTPLLVATRVIAPPNSSKPINAPPKPLSKTQLAKNQNGRKPLISTLAQKEKIFLRISTQNFKISIISFFY